MANGKEVENPEAILIEEKVEEAVVFLKTVYPAIKTDHDPEWEVAEPRIRRYVTYLYTIPYYPGLKLRVTDV